MLGVLVITEPEAVENMKHLVVEEQTGASFSLVRRNGLPDVITSLNSLFHRVIISPLHDMNVKHRSGEEHLKLRETDVRSREKARVESGERRREISLDDEGVSELRVEVAGPEVSRDILRDRGSELESLEEEVALRREGGEEVITVAEQAESPELEIEGGRNRLEEEERALEMGLGVVDVVRVTEEKG